MRHSYIRNDAEVFDNGYLRVEHCNYYVACGGMHVLLSRKQFLIISRLARNPERIVPAQDLWKFAWGEGPSFNGASLRVHICRLRQMLSPYGIRIESMVNVGYCLSVPVAAAVGEIPATPHNGN